MVSLSPRLPPESAENRERDRELQRSMSHVRRCLLESRMLLVHRVLGSRGACRVVGLVLTLCYAIRDRGYADVCEKRKILDEHPMRYDTSASQKVWRADIFTMLHRGSCRNFCARSGEIRRRGPERGQSPSHRHKIRRKNMRPGHNVCKHSRHSAHSPGESTSSSKSSRLSKYDLTAEMSRASPTVSGTGDGVCAEGAGDVDDDASPAVLV